MSETNKPNNQGLDEIREKVSRIINLETQINNHEQMPNCRQDDLKFPESVMTGVAGDFADLYSSYLESPKEFFFVAFLTCEGTLLANQLTLDTEITPQPRLFTILLGESADDRKSTAIMKTVDFFREFYEDRFTVCSGVGSAEGLQQMLKKTENAGLLLCFDEFKMFVNKCRIEGSVLLPCVNTLFEANRYESQTKKAGISIQNAHLSILGASTIQTYQNIWLPQFTDIGFNNRLFLVPGTADRKHAFPNKIPNQEKQKISRQIDKILRAVRSGKKLRITEEARRVFEAWYLGMGKNLFSKRIDTYAQRLMGLIAINENKQEIDSSTVSKAIQLCDWQIQVRRLNDPIDAETTIAKMEIKIRRQLSVRGDLTERQLRQNTNANRDGLWAFNTAMTNLQKASDIFLTNKEDRRWGIRS